jgi:hypothetical protein
LNSIHNNSPIQQSQLRIVALKQQPHHLIVRVGIAMRGTVDLFARTQTMRNLRRVLRKLVRGRRRLIEPDNSSATNEFCSSSVDNIAVVGGVNGDQQRANDSIA